MATKTHNKTFQDSVHALVMWERVNASLQSLHRWKHYKKRDTNCFEMAGRHHFFAALYFDPVAAFTTRWVLGNRLRLTFEFFTKYSWHLQEGVKTDIQSCLRNKSSRWYMLFLLLPLLTLYRLGHQWDISDTAAVIILVMYCQKWWLVQDFLCFIYFRANVQGW